MRHRPGQEIHRSGSIEEFWILPPDFLPSASSGGPGRVPGSSLGRGKRLSDYKGRQADGAVGAVRFRVEHDTR